MSAYIQEFATFHNLYLGTIDNDEQGKVSVMSKIDN